MSIFQITFFAISLFCFIQKSVSQKVFYNLDYLNSEKGLLEDKYNEFIYKDSKGFVWIGSTQGISRYDGMNINSFPNTQEEKEKIIGRNVQSSFFEDERSNIWFSTYNALIQYNRKTESWKSFQFKNSKGELITTEYRVFHLDSKAQNLWLSLKNEIIIFDLKDLNEIDRIDLGLTPIHVEIQYNTFDSQFELLAYSPIYQFAELISYSFNKGLIGKRKIEFPKDRDQNIFFLRKVIYRGDETYFFITNKGLYSYNSKKDDFIQLNTGEIANLRNGVIKSENELILCSNDQGLYSYDINQNYLYKINIQAPSTLELTRSNTRGIHLDSEHNIWISYMDEGIEEIRSSDMLFIDPFNELLKSPEIKGIINGINNKVWTLTKDKGVFQFTPEGNISLFEKESPEINQENLKSIQKGKDGNTYILGPHSIFQYNSNTNHWDNILTDLTEEFKSFYVTENGIKLLLTTGGLYRINSNSEGNFLKRDDAFKAYLDFPFDNIFGDENYIFLSFESNEIWVSKIDINNKFVVKQKIITKGAVVDHIKIDTILYLGTERGLMRMTENGDSLKAEYIAEIDEKSLSIFSMTIDNEDNLWLGTSNGLYIYDAKEQSIKGFFEKDGFQSNYYVGNAALTDKNGNLWFGTDKGLTVFNPSNVTSYPHPPKVVLENLKINNEKYPLEKLDSNNELINLKYSQRNIEFKLLALTSYYPERSVLNFQLNGEDDDWNQVENGAVIRYPKLGSGHYNFNYYAENINNTRSEVKNLQIHIKPPFWFTWWFLSLSSIFLIGLIIWAIATYFRLQYQKELEKRNLIYSEQSRISNDVHDEVSQGLSIIRFISEDQSAAQNSKETKDSFQSINEWAKTAQNNLNNIIFSLTPEHNDLKTTFEEIKDYCSKFLHYYPISWNIHFPENIPNKTLSGEKRRALFLILKEAIHNTVKHSRAENLNMHFDLVEDSLQILIEDDGIGIGEVSNTRGKGLNTMPERAQQVGGTFSLSSKPNQGTRIIVNLPFEEDIPKGFRSLFIKFLNQFRK